MHREHAPTRLLTVSHTGARKSRNEHNMATTEHIDDASHGRNDADYVWHTYPAGRPPRDPRNDADYVWHTVILCYPALRTRTATTPPKTS